MRKVSTCISPWAEDQRVPRAASQRMRHQLGRQADADAGRRIDHHAPAERVLVVAGGGQERRALPGGQHAGDLGLVALLEALDGRDQRVLALAGAGIVAVPRSAPPGSCAAHRAGCRRQVPDSSGLIGAAVFLHLAGFRLAAAPGWRRWRDFSAAFGDRPWAPAAAAALYGWRARSWPVVPAALADGLCGAWSPPFTALAGATGSIPVPACP